MRYTLFMIGYVLTATLAPSQYAEPAGGLFPTSLTIFQDKLNRGVVTNIWGGKASIDDRIVRSGSASWRWDISEISGMHLMWGGWDKDTTVFWVHGNSHVSFWIRPSSSSIKMQVQLGYMDGQYDVIPMQEIGASSTWKYYDVLVPTSALRRPLNELKFIFTGTGSSGGTVHLDDIKISMVRLYAGKGVLGSIRGIFADQLGYDTYGYKTFSAEEYKSFSIIRVGDNKVMYSGTDKRAVTSRAVGDNTVYVGEFTKFQVPGSYYIQLDNGKKSYPFEIGPNVYDATTRASVRFFYYQRNNTAIVMPYAEGPWVHEKDEKELVLLPKSIGGTKIVRKGWHDAGDLAIYMPNHTYACYWLLAAWDDFRYGPDNLNIPESGNGVPDLIDEIRWGLDWILDMQDEKDGGFFHNMCVNKNSPYNYGRTTALTITGYELTNKTTAATASAVAALAYASKIFSEFDKKYADRLQRAALKGWEFLESNSQQINITENCDTYQDADDIHARFFASAALFLASGDEKFNRYFLLKDPGSGWISDYNNQTNLAYALYLKSTKGDAKKQSELRNMLVSKAQEANADRDKHPFGFVGYYYWGSLGTSFARVGNYNLIDWRLNRNLNSLFTAQQQLHYTFGQNSLNFVYFSGFGENGMKQGFHHWMKALNATPRSFPGLLAGGPNENPDPNERNMENTYNKSPDTPIDQRYTDNDSWSTNEIAVNQNAQLTYALCAAWAYAKSQK
jgi:endoglucanase